jgi:trk system potassium uptake protein TrkH
MSKVLSPLTQTFVNVSYVFGNLLMITGLFMIVPLVFALYYQQADIVPFAISIAIALVVGVPCRYIWGKNINLGQRDAFIITTFGWVVISALSGLPFMLHGSIPSFTDAFWEMMSGYTTTGATILNDIEALPHGLLLWRSETHFIGGMGFITFVVLLLPHGMGGVRLFRAESSPGQALTGERFVARNKDAIGYLWSMYAILNFVQVVLYLFGGMTFFDALCHAFGTLSTSGYSTYNTSVAHFNSAYIDWVTIVFMFLGGVTFTLFFSVYKRDWHTLSINTELRWYIGVTSFFCLCMAIILVQAGIYPTLDALRHGSFQTISLLTTTGFTTTDYETWPELAKMLLLIVSFIGGCTGSTSSGIKILHYILIWRFIVASVKQQFVQPLSVVSVRVNEERISQSVITLAMCYFIANIVLILVGGCVVVAAETGNPFWLAPEYGGNMDFGSALSAVLTCLFNIGPGFGDLGPTHNFAGFTDFSKWYLSMNMLLGRLELFSALILLYPSFWKE